MTEERSVSRSSPVPKVEMPLRMPRISSLLSHPSELEFGMRSWLSSSRAPWSRMSLSFPLLHVSVIALLVLFSFLLNPSKSAVAPGLCSTHDLPNPIASEFPNNATGVLNATLAIVPIPLEAARRIIPSRYNILEHAYREILPNFPEGMYPLLVQAAHDHDVQMRAFGFAIDDFSRAGLEFPFVDLLNDGYTSFKWAPAQLISSENEIAIQGSQAYGTAVTPAGFDPLCDAYRRLPNGASYFKGAAVDKSKSFMELEFSRLSSRSSSVESPYSVAAFKNMTNQPTFANGNTCDNMIRLFNDTMSTGSRSPVPVKGRVRANLAPLQGEENWTGVYGFQVATPFIENNYLDCRTMQGYKGTGGPGDTDIPTSSFI